VRDKVSAAPLKHDFGEMMDYYKVLAVERTVSEDELKKAYKVLAMKWHPDKNKGNETAAEKRFKEVGEAYHVLSDAQRRAVYDNGGTQPTPENDGNVYPQGGGGHYEYVFNAKDAENLFAQMFSKQLFGLYGADSVLLNALNGQRPNNPTRGAGTRRKAEEIVKDLQVPLEDLYAGSNKRFKIERRQIDDSGRSSLVDQVIEVDIKPGWKTGTKITFENHGDDDPNGDDPADLTFVIKEIPHPIYKRDGDDLVCPVRISLGKALTNPTIPLITLDKRRLNVAVEDIITPGYRTSVRGEGMPIAKEPHLRGNLHLDFTVIFPTSLTAAQKAAIAQNLP
jgi:DnaJ family protein B protein 4